jgi:hypothetical protein
VGQAAEAGDADPDFELCLADERGAERRELRVSWPGAPGRGLPGSHRRSRSDLRQPQKLALSNLN